jgi:small subunit ribosomal protein S3
MGQKVNPVGFRLPVNRAWRSKWFATKKNFGSFLVEDSEIREFVKKRLSEAGLSKIIIERYANRVRVTLMSARPGVIIGRKGQDVDKIRDELSKMTKKEVYLEIKEVRDADADAQLVAENTAQQLEKRISFRRAMKQSIGNAMRRGAKGIKIMCSGRLGGAEIARSEQYHEGTIPLQTLRADIDYGFAEANTTYGKVGVKVWLYKGEVLNINEAKPARRPRREGGRK